MPLVRLTSAPLHRPALALALAVLLSAPAAGAQDARAARASKPALTAVRGIVRGDDVVRSARRYLGVPYVLGGETPEAFDCSGFVRWVFAEYGIGFPRTAKEQAAFGQAPPWEDNTLLPGDLLFFYGGQGAQHIAIYVGRDSIIHASSSGRRVKLDRFVRRAGRPTWFNQRLIAVRRVLPMEGVFYLSGSGSSEPRPQQTADATPGAPR